MSKRYGQDANCASFPTKSRKKPPANCRTTPTRQSGIWRKRDVAQHHLDADVQRHQSAPAGAIGLDASLKRRKHALAHFADGGRKPRAAGALRAHDRRISHVGAANANTFTATATYQNSDGEASKCLTFTINGAGTKGSTPYNDCWTNTRR